MNAILLNKYQLTSNMLKSHVALMLLLFLSVSFSNVVEASDVSTQEQAILVADFESVADSISDFDADDDSVSIAYAVTENVSVVLSTATVQTKTAYYLNFTNLRPLTRAPPKTFS